MSTGPTSGRPIRVGIVGTGFAASSHLDALARLPGVAVAGVAGSSPDRARAAAERLGIGGLAYPDLEALLGDPEVDAVHNCTPNHLHAQVTLQALAAGKHVLSEKPLAIDSEESARLVAAASGASLVTGVCCTYRHFPLIQQVRATLAGGEPGSVHLVHGSYLQDWLLHPDDWNWRLESAKAGPTRAVGDIGSHWVDTVEHVTGDRVVEVMADLGRLYEERLRPVEEVATFARGDAEGTRYPVDTEDFGSVLVRLASGARGAFSVSQVSPGRKNRLWFEVDTARAAFVWDQEEPNRLWIGRRDGPNRELVRDPSLLGPSAAPLAHYPGGHQEGWPDALRNLFADFYAAVAGRGRGELYQPTFASFEDGHHVVQVVEAVAESHRTRSWIPVAGAASGSTEGVTTEVVS
ncbi:MAG: Gfo/Idh/MocA family protein [Actinomycetota bacterium]